MAQKTIHHIKKGIITCLKWIRLNLLTKPHWICKIIANPSQYCKHKSYYPELPPKSAGRIWFEQIGQVIRFGYPNEFYFSYGFDVKNSRQMKQYFHYAPFARLRDAYNNSQSPHNSTSLLRNKLYFDMLCDYMGISTARNLGIIIGKEIYCPISKQFVSYTEFCKRNHGNFFVKIIDGECGSGIFRLSIDQENIIYINSNQASLSELKELTADGTFLIQQIVEQHPLLASLHPQSLNTIRLVTVRNIHSGKIATLPSILRIGTGDNFVDNTSQGGVAVGIELPSGKLLRYGFLKPQFGGRIDSHPDTGIRFSDFTIPFMEQAINQAIYLHSMLSDVNTIGWDIAIGPKGPIFIEGNDNWEINGPQICNGPLKEALTNLLTSKKMY